MILSFGAFVVIEIPFLTFVANVLIKSEPLKSAHTVAAVAIVAIVAIYFRSKRY
jgi:drug/metabolite transporter (DMT)-like permease